MDILPQIRSAEAHRSHPKPPEVERENYDGIVNYIEHGYPSPRVRWHCHDEYELHLIVSTSGKLFVGDYIGEFSPGHLVLTGPRLPHNWISNRVPEEGVLLRDMILQFAHEPLEQAAKSIPELRELLPLLERSTYGIEFLAAAGAEAHFLRIRASRGAERFAHFLQFMSELARSSNYRLLSNATMRSYDDDATLAKVNAVLNYITENYREPLSAEALAEQLGMSLSKFSRFFRKTTGNSFTDFVSRIRINKACQLLMNTDQYVTNVCYDVGFHNVANFNRRFLQVKGVTPKEFRRQADGRFGA
ncbi:AraC family transcriptional regulator [Janthinobacterium sp.]|uniref:AraC family transcriptional regulator n=1 Tax=Janthinobacterium sp. TaxID=1871054 RepID=UPI00293D6ABF|nr:AraC family transcriptional regulator [Janthinobacterium sp.]